MTAVQSFERGGLFKDIRRSWPLVVLAVVLGGVGGWGLAMTQPTLYTAEAQVFLLNAEDAGVFRAARTERELRLHREVRWLESEEVAARAAEILGAGRDPDNIRRKTRAIPVLPLDMIEVRATAAGPDEAVLIADATVRAYRELRRQNGLDLVQRASAELDTFTADLRVQLDDAERRLEMLRLSHEPELPALGSVSERATLLSALLERDPAYAEARAIRDAVLTQLLSVETRLRELRADAAVVGDGVEFTQPASRPSSPSQPKPERDLLLGVLLGGVAGVGLARLRAERTMPLNTRELADSAGLRLIGAMPSVDRGERGDDGRAIEAMEVIVAALAHAAHDEGAIIVICAPTPHCGATTVAANLALVATRKGLAPTLVDVDLRDRALTRLVSNDDALGVLQLAAGTHSHAEVEQLVLHGRNVTAFIGAGRRPERGSADLPSGRWRELPQWVEARDRLVIIDAPAVLTSGVPLELAEIAHGVVLVAGPETTATELQDARTRLDYVGAKVLGVVANAGPGSRRFRRRRSPDGLVSPVVTRRAALTSPKETWRLPQTPPVG